MERAEAIRLIKALKNVDFHSLALKHGVTVELNGRQNKGWAGHCIERCLGLALNSSRAPNFGSWELKVVPLHRKSGTGLLRAKETMAITMIDPVEVANKEFEESHLYKKLRQLVVVGRIVGSHYLQPTVLYDAVTFDLDNHTLSTVKADYNLVRSCLLDSKRGFSHLTGSMGTLIQPRTKGPGHGSVSRAFYARPAFLDKLFGFI